MRQLKYETRGSLYSKLMKTKFADDRKWHGSLRWDSDTIAGLLVKEGYLKPPFHDRWDWIKPVDEKAVEAVIEKALRSLQSASSPSALHGFWRR